MTRTGPESYCISILYHLKTDKWDAGYEAPWPNSSPYDKTYRFFSSFFFFSLASGTKLLKYLGLLLLLLLLFLLLLLLLGYETLGKYI